MKKTVMLAFLAAVFTLVMIPSAQAAPLCIAANTQVTLAAQIAQGDCDFNGYTFNFQSVNISATPGPNPPVGTTPAVGANQAATNAATNIATLVRLTAANALSLMVEYFANDASTSWSVPSGETTWNYHYDITPIAPNVGLVQDTYSAVNAFSTFAALTLSGFKEVTGASGDFQTSLPHPTANSYQTVSDTLNFAFLPGTIHVQDSLSLRNFAGLYGTVGGPGNPGILQNQLTFTTVPEPLTMFVSGAGLVAIGLLRRRAKKA
jgi:hypothetical protein